MQTTYLVWSLANNLGQHLALKSAWITFLWDLSWAKRELRSLSFWNQFAFVLIYTAYPKKMSWVKLVINQILKIGPDMPIFSSSQRWIQDLEVLGLTLFGTWTCCALHHVNWVNIWFDYCSGCFVMLSIEFCHDFFISLFLFLFCFGIFFPLGLYQEGSL